MNDDQQIGFQGGDDEDEMPPEMKAHMLAAFAHHAGLGPHPGKYKGPPRKKRDPDEPTDTDMQRAQEEPLEEASAKKMRQAQMGLAPSEMERAQVKQQGALQQQMATQGAMKAQQAQGGMTQAPPPQAPTGPAGTTAPYPAQAADVGPKETPETPASSGAPPSPPPAPGAQEGPPEAD
jgi:hypothetical protein